MYNIFNVFPALINYNPKCVENCHLATSKWVNEITQFNGKQKELQMRKTYDKIIDVEEAVKRKIN